MNKKLKILTKNLQKLFDSGTIEKMGLKHKFVKRKSKLTEENKRKREIKHKEEIKKGKGVKHQC